MFRCNSVNWIPEAPPTWSRCSKGGWQACRPHWGEPSRRPPIVAEKKIQFCFQKILGCIFFKWKGTFFGAQANRIRNSRRENFYACKCQIYWKTNQIKFIIPSVKNTIVAWSIIFKARIPWIQWRLWNVVKCLWNSIWDQDVNQQHPSNNLLECLNTLKML